LIIFLKKKVCDKDEKNAYTFNFSWEPRIQHKEKQISKVPRVIYNEFKNLLERDPGKTLSNLTIPTKLNWWGTKSLSKMIFMVWYHDIIAWYNSE